MLRCYRATMAIDDQYDGEVVDRATKCPKCEIAVSTRWSPTDKSKAHPEAPYQDTDQQVYKEVDRQVCRDTHRQVYEVDQDSTDTACRELNHEVYQMVTKADFEWQLT